MKFAVLILYELRSIYKTFDNYSKYLIDYYNADIFIICQKQFENDIEKLNLFKKYGDRVKVLCLYIKPSPLEYFGLECMIKLKNSMENFISPGNFQVYINHYEVVKYMNLYVDIYDYFIHMRIDSEILFNFPNPELFKTIPNAIYTFNPTYCRSWGGSGGGNFIHSKYFIDYFKSYYDAIMDPNMKKMISNQEEFLKYSLLKKNIVMLPINKINYYYTAEKETDYTTWSKPHLNLKYNVICKYDEQCEEAHEALKMWQDDYKWMWDNNNNCIDLIKR